MAKEPQHGPSGRPEEAAFQRLSNVLLKPKSEEEMVRFLEDLFSPQEARQFADRWAICELLIQGLSQRQVKEKLGVSISVVSRAARCLNYGSGGLRRVFQRVHPPANNR